MADVAAHVVDDVFLEVPVRRWVWSFHTALGYDSQLCADVMRAWARALERSYRHRAKRLLGLASVEDALSGAVTFARGPTLRCA